MKVNVDIHKNSQWRQNLENQDIEQKPFKSWILPITTFNGLKNINTYINYAYVNLFLDVERHENPQKSTCI